MNTLTLVHHYLAQFIRPGDFVIDATAGNGRDTAFLCELTGERGQVLAFDIQPQAVENTRRRLAETGWDAVGRVVLDSHANMARYAQPGSVDCIVFNLGWLPGGDHSIFTRPDSTIAAIEAGLTLLRDGGLLCVSIYYGGASGYEERDALLDYVATIDPARYTVLTVQFANRAGDPPIPVFILKDT
ncbi:MAG TPA: methyltransferase domain-containing protein [Candidatus Butyricicoccus stercorigallinarum]|nr:methyltransferase domain-containing protein [Candidatus Butyricicoccus stercorigallinarum]